MLRILHLIRQPASGCHLPLKGKALICKLLLYSKSQRLEPLASNIGLLALVHTTRLTGGYDFVCDNRLFSGRRGSRPLPVDCLCSRVT